VDYSREITEDGKKDVDPEVGIATALTASQVSSVLILAIRVESTHRKTPRGGRRMA
jgi:hypothetical protein